VCSPLINAQYHIRLHPKKKYGTPSVLVQFFCDNVIKILYSLGMETMLVNVLYIKLCIFAFLETALNKECFTHFVSSEYVLYFVQI